MMVPRSARPLALVSVVAPADAAWLAQWETHLLPLEQAHLISIWSQRHLMPGAHRLHECQRQIESADLVLLLLSPDFFADPECCSLMEHVLAFSRSSIIRVIPLLLRPVAWQESPLKTLTPWPPPGTPIALWGQQDEGWDACIQEVRRLLGRRVSEVRSSQASSMRSDPDWDRMLRLLRRSYRELRNQSLHGIAWIELGLSRQPDLVSNVTNLLFRLPDGGERLLAPGTSIIDAFDEAEGELLILGAPGAGKSTLLLDLACDLVDRAQAGEITLLPVILRLSSWALQQSPLAEWMTEHLSRTYDVPRQLSQRWITEGRVLPLLDGLDEMEEAARTACIAAINAYHRTHLAPLVVCSRHAEYEVIATHKRLALQSAVIVQPLSDEQIESYLQDAGPSFAGIRAALSQQHELWKLATTPLMLSVLLLTYQGSSTDNIVKQDTDLEQQVWTDYVNRMVAEKGNATSYPLKHTRTFLGWLALQMRVHQQTTFYAEQLHIDWLPAHQQRRTAMWLTTLLPSIVIGACVALLVSLFILQFTDDPVHLFQMSILGGFIGGCLRSSDAEKDAGSGQWLQKGTMSRLRNVMLLGGLLAASYGLYLQADYISDYSPGFGLSDWLRHGYLLGLGSALSGWAFQARLAHVPTQRSQAVHARLGLRGRFLRWMNTMGSLHVWQAAALLGGGIWLSAALSAALNYGLLSALLSGLSDGLSVSVTVVLAYLILVTALKIVRLAEHVRWTGTSLFQLQHLRTTALMTVILFLFFGLGYGLSYGLSIRLSEGLTFGLGKGLSVGLSVGLSYWLVLGLYQGMKQEHLEEQSRSQFNQGIWRSLRNGSLVSLISAVIIMLMCILSDGLSEGLSYGLLYGLNVGLSHGLSYGLSHGLSYGLSDGLIYGLSDGLNHGLFVLIVGFVVMWALSGGPTVLRHYVIRWLLARHHLFPFRAQAFLDDATSRVLLRRVGGGYSFIHRRLQDYFADAAVPPSET